MRRRLPRGPRRIPATPVEQHDKLICIGGPFEGVLVNDAGALVDVWDQVNPETKTEYHRFLIAPPDRSPATYARCYVAAGMEMSEARRRLRLLVTMPPALTPAQQTAAVNPPQRYREPTP